MPTNVGFPTILILKYLDFLCHTICPTWYNLIGQPEEDIVVNISAFQKLVEKLSFLIR